MAKRFGGFTPEQMGKIVPEMQGMQADEQAKFLAATPGAAARVGAMTERARAAIEGKPVGMAAGGVVNAALPIVSAVASTVGSNAGAKVAQQPTPSTSTAGTPQAQLDAAQQTQADALRKLREAQAAQTANPADAAIKEAAAKAQVEADRTAADANAALSQYKATELPSASEMLATASSNPMSLTNKADVKTTTAAQAAAGKMDATVGQAGAADQATTSTANTAAPVAAPTVTPAATVAPTTATTEVENTVAALVAATGKPSADAIADAATMTPAQLAQLGISPAQLAAAQKVVAPAARTLQQDELIQGSTVDMARVKVETNFAAATGVPSSEATVQGQLTGLLQQFEGSKPPAWAAGAMRAATAALASRGLGASSMAGQAVVQAAMESALPIAQADANTRAQFEAQNLSNRQATSMFAAQQRANFLGVEFDQNFQSRVQNASRIADIANMNFSAEQQIALENARMAQSVDLANLSNRNAKVLSDAASLTQVDVTNLNNRQQAQVENAKSFLQMDMTNLSNEQQATIFRGQAVVNSLLSDAAADNAAKQFNASSENQTNQFFSNLSAQVAQFNSDQSNAMERFNAGEENAVAQFNANQRNLREQFNATNSLVIEQANAQWAQTISTVDNAATNQANRDAALVANQMTSNAFNAMMQETRDLMSYAFQSADNDATRATNMAIAKIASQDAATAAAASKKSSLWGAIGNIAATAVGAWIEG